MHAEVKSVAEGAVQLQQAKHGVKHGLPAGGHVAAVGPVVLPPGLGPPEDSDDLMIEYNQHWEDEQHQHDAQAAEAKWYQDQAAQAPPAPVPVAQVRVPVPLEAGEIPVMLNGVQLDKGSPVSALQDRLKQLDAPFYGSKKIMWDRLQGRERSFQANEKVRLALEARARQVALNPALAQVPVVLPGVKLPTDKERELHEATHIPIAAWCEHCQRGKARENPHNRVTFAPESDPLPEIDLGLTTAPLRLSL